MSLTTQQFTDRFGAEELLALTDPTSRQTVNTDVFHAAVEDAFAEITGMLNHVKKLDRDALPTAIVAILADLTRARLYVDTAPEIVLVRAQQARRFIDDLAHGKATLNAYNPVDVRVKTKPEIFPSALWQDYGS